VRERWDRSVTDTVAVFVPGGQHGPRPDSPGCHRCHCNHSYIFAIKLAAESPDLVLTSCLCGLIKIAGQPTSEARQSHSHIDRSALCVLLSSTYQQQHAAVLVFVRVVGTNAGPHPHIYEWQQFASSSHAFLSGSHTIVEYTMQQQCSGISTSDRGPMDRDIFGCHCPVVVEWVAPVERRLPGSHGDAAYAHASE